MNKPKFKIGDKVQLTEDALETYGQHLAGIQRTVRRITMTEDKYLYHFFEIGPTYWEYDLEDTL